MMHSMYLNSACRSSYFHVPSYLLDTRCEINPLLISSSLVTNCCSCCCCCTNNNNYNYNHLVYNRLPRINPSFVCNGLMQSTLIQFSPSKRLVYHGRRRQICSNTNISDSDRNFYYKKLYSSNEGRKLSKGRYTCLGHNDKRDTWFVSNDETDDDYVDEVELLLDLLTEEVGLENVGVKERNRVEMKKDDGYFTGKMKSVRSGSIKKDLKCGNKGVEIRSMEEDRRTLRNERREEEKRSFVKGVNCELRKEGSSCSSYYSVSSTAEYENGNDDVEIRRDEGFVRGVSSSEYKDNRKLDSYVKSYDEKVEENVDGQCKEEHESMKKNSVDVYNGNEEWRKKSEKKLNVESSQQQSQVSQSSVQNSQQDILKMDGIADQSQSMKYKRLMEKSELDSRVIESSTNKRYSDTEYKLVTDRRESADCVTRQNEYRKQSNVKLEASRIHEIDKKGTSELDNKVTESSTNRRYRDTEYKLITSRRESADLVTRRNEYRKQSNVNLEASRNHEIYKKESSELDNKVTESSTNKRYSDTEYKLITDRRENADRSTRRNEYKKQSNVNLEASRIHEIDKKEASTSSSSLEARMKNWEDYTTDVSDQVEDRREENQQRIDQLTTFKEPRFQYQQISEISDNRLTNTKSNSRRETKELHIASSSSTEKVTMDQQVDLRRKGIEDKYTSSGVELVEGPTKLVTTGRRTTRASSYTVRMPKEATSNYKAMKLNPEPNFQQTGARDADKRGTFLIGTTSAGEIFHEDAIVSADKQHKSSSHYVGEFVKKAKHKLSISEVQQEKETDEVGLVYEDDEQHELRSSGDDDSGYFDRKDGASGPSDEMWHETGASIQQPAGTDAPDSTGNDDTAKRSGRSLWNVIGDVVRLRWASPWSETLTPKSGAGSTKVRKESSKPSSTKDKLDSPLLVSSSSNTNQGSSSKTMSPSVIEESSFPLPAIRMRRSPIVKRTSETDKTDASTSGKMDKVDPKTLTQVSQTDASGSGKMVIVDQSVPTRRKLGRIDQVSKDIFDEWEEAYTVEAKQRQQDELFMREALLEAKKAADFWEVPVGAVLVQDGKVIARGYNLVEELRDSTAHAEMICIREASTNLRSWRLSGTTLYVTLEPCPMCAGAILQARVDTVVWGAPNKLLGADGSWIRLFPDVDRGNGSDKPPGPVHPFHPNMVVRRGVLSAECADVMQQFFQLRRKKKEKKTEAEPPTPPPPSCLPIPQHHNSKFLSRLHDTFGIMFCL